MKPFHLLPLLFLAACSTTPRLALRPQLPPPLTDAAGIRQPEVVHAYHVGRYADPEDDSTMHEQHVVYRVEENTRWDFHPGAVSGNALQSSPVLRDAAYSPAPVNDAILAEVNSQRLATAQIMVQARTLASALAQFQIALQQAKTNLQETAALRATVNDIKQRLDALEAAPRPPPSISTNNEPGDPLNP
jgi:hypothetical protein